jgi:hypothetical protein
VTTRRLSSSSTEETFTLLKAISDKRYAVLVAENGYLIGRVNNLEIGDLARIFIQLSSECHRGSKM